jgi:hypothetical protein
MMFSEEEWEQLEQQKEFFDSYRATIEASHVLDTRILRKGTTLKVVCSKAEIVQYQTIPRGRCPTASRKSP